MKHTLCAAMFVLCSSFATQDNKTIIDAQFDRLQGEWEGFMEYVDMAETGQKITMPAKCTTTFDGNKWTYEVLFDEGNGTISEGGGDCVVNGDGTTMNYNGVVWNVMDIEEKGDTVRILMITAGKENRRKIALRQMLEVTSTTFSLSEEGKYDTETEYKLRNRYLFRKKKK